MIMYGVCMNLHVEFVRVVSSFAWIITSILTQIQIVPKDQTKAKIFNCKWGDSCTFCSITVAMVMTKRLISFLNLPALFEKSSSRSNIKLGWYGLRQPCSMVTLVLFPTMDSGKAT